MANAPIPPWNARGVLPPNDPLDPTAHDRSPYPVPLLDVVMRFATSAERRAILQGLLNFRAALHRMGLVGGFQWLDGSFMEHVELLEKRAPRDIDVVTFLDTPAVFAPTPPDDAALRHTTAKARFKVDSYLVELDATPPRDLTLLSAYWYSVWSHRRTAEWKGFLQVDLSPREDGPAQAWLNATAAAGTQAP
jgi:hypothetical protein